MSIQALAWAFDQEMYSSSHKFVLVALANYCNPNGMCYPSVATIGEITAQSEQTVRSALTALVLGNYIKDTGKRFGKTQQVKVYQLPPEAREKTPKNHSLSKEPNLLGNQDEDPTKALGRLCEDPKKPGANQEPVTNNHRKRAAGPTRFQKPTLEQVLARGESIALPRVECEKFMDYYEANGWKVGKNSMKVWTSALANWKRHWEEYSGSGGQGINGSDSPSRRPAVRFNRPDVLSDPDPDHAKY